MASFTDHSAQHKDSSIHTNRYEVLTNEPGRQGSSQYAYVQFTDSDMSQPSHNQHIQLSSNHHTQLSNSHPTQQPNNHQYTQLSSSQHSQPTCSSCQPHEPSAGEPLLQSYMTGHPSQRFAESPFVPSLPATSNMPTYYFPTQHPSSYELMQPNMAPTLAPLHMTSQFAQSPYGSAQYPAADVTVAPSLNRSAYSYPSAAVQCHPMSNTMPSFINPQGMSDQIPFSSDMTPHPQHLYAAEHYPSAKVTPPVYRPFNPLSYSTTPYGYSNMTPSCSLPPNITPLQVQPCMAVNSQQMTHVTEQFPLPSKMSAPNLQLYLPANANPQPYADQQFCQNPSMTAYHYSQSNTQCPSSFTDRHRYQQTGHISNSSSNYRPYPPAQYYSPSSTVRYPCQPETAQPFSLPSALPPYGQYCTTGHPFSPLGVTQPKHPPSLPQMVEDMDTSPILTIPSNQNNPTNCPFQFSMPHPYFGPQGLVTHQSSPSGNNSHLDMRTRSMSSSLDGIHPPRAVRVCTIPPPPPDPSPQSSDNGTHPIPPPVDRVRRQSLNSIRPLPQNRNPQSDPRLMLSQNNISNTSNNTTPTIPSPPPVNLNQQSVDVPRPRPLLRHHPLSPVPILSLPSPTAQTQPLSRSTTTPTRLLGAFYRPGTPAPYEDVDPHYDDNGYDLYDSDQDNEDDSDSDEPSFPLFRLTTRIRIAELTRSNHNLGLNDDQALAAGIAASLNPNQTTRVTTPEAGKRALAQHLEKCLKLSAHSIKVNRADVWGCSLAFFKTITISERDKQLMVLFRDSQGKREEAVDDGGPRREYLQLLLEAIVRDSGMLYGDADQGLLIRPNISHHCKQHFRILGTMLATIIAQRGRPPAIFAPPVVDAILNEDPVTPLKYVPSAEVRRSLQKVSDAESAEELEEALEDCQWRYELDGVPARVTMDNREEFLTICVHYYVILNSRPMLDQMMDGLKHCGILDLIRTYKIRHLLEYDPKATLTAEEVWNFFVSRDLFPDVEEKERKILTNLRDVFTAIENGSLYDDLRQEYSLNEAVASFVRSLTLSKVLTFVTGCGQEPAGGFYPLPSIVFQHSDTWSLPHVSTCSNELHIVVHENAMTSSRLAMALVTSMMNSEIFTRT